MLGLFKPKKKTAQTKILMVDDENDIVSTVQYRLESCKFKVNMPVMDGHEMLERLRNNTELKNTPVIMLTAYSDKGDISKAANMGIADYITKPFEFTELMEKISRSLNDTAVSS